MGNPCKVSLVINDVTESLEDLGFHLMESPDMLAAPIREYEAEEYPERDGEFIYPHTSSKPFDYTCKFLYMGTLDEAKTMVHSLWSAFFAEPSTQGGVRQARLITLVNHYKQDVVGGYAKEMPGEEYIEQYRDGLWIFNLTIHVSDPSLCSFSGRIK